MGSKNKTVGGSPLFYVLVKMTKFMREHPYVTLIIEATLYLLLAMTILTPDAWASGGGGSKLSNSGLTNTSTAMGNINKIVSGLLLPIGIAWASWQIIYIALVCGVIGIDPLNLLGGSLDQDVIWAEVRKRFKNFAFGIAWVAGIWIVFELVLFLVSNLVGVLKDNL